MLIHAGADISNTQEQPGDTPGLLETGKCNTQKKACHLVMSGDRLAPVGGKGWAEPDKTVANTRRGSGQTYRRIFWDFIQQRRQLKGKIK